MVSTRSLRQPRPPLIREAVFRGAAFALLWWLLTGGEAGSWVVGVPAIIAATALSCVLAPVSGPGPRMARLPSFALYFLRESVAGGADVVARALHPAMPLQPGFITVPVTRLGPFQRLAFTVLVSLMPGTLSARLDRERLVVHVLDSTLPLVDGLARLEDRLDQLFGGERCDGAPR